MSVQVAVKESGPGSFGYPWGTERPTAFLERLDQAIHPNQEDEIRRIREEAERKIRQVEMRRSVLTQIRESVANCCVPTSSGKLRFKRELADAAGPLIDVETLRGVVDLDRRRPGRPSANENSEMLAFRSALRELVYDPAAEERERRGAVTRQANRARPGLPAVQGSLAMAAPDPEPDIVSAAGVVGQIQDASSFLEPANEDDAPFVAPVPDVEPAPLPVLDSQALELDRFLGTPGIAASSNVPQRLFKMQVVDLYTPSVLAERERRVDRGRLPAGYDPAWGDHWQPDPNAPLPEMIETFGAFGAAIDKKPADLTDEEAFDLAAPAYFSDFNLDYKSGRRVPNPKAYRRGKPYDEARLSTEIRRAGGTAQKYVAEFHDLVDPLRREERARRHLWTYVLQRRESIKALMAEVALGTLSVAPRTMRMSDLERSVQWRVFLRDDHTAMLLSGRYRLEMYHQRLLDRLPWPEGLSRRELLEAFGGGVDPLRLPNLSYYGRPPRWLVPDHLWAFSTEMRPLSVDREAYELSRAAKRYAGEIEAMPGAPVVPRNRNAKPLECVR